MKMKFSDYEKSQFETAQSLSKKGHFTKALPIMKKLVEYNPNVPVFHCFLGDILSELGDFVNAEKEFKLATHLAPNSELSSICLFHCLWGQSKKLEAIEEKIRLTSLIESEEYRKLWKDFGIED